MRSTFSRCSMLHGSCGLLICQVALVSSNSMPEPSAAADALQRTVRSCFQARLSANVMRRLMRRREFIVFLGGAVAALPPGGGAQQPGNVSTIGYLSDSSPANPSPHPEPFRQGLRDLGYIEGKNITMEYRYAEGVVERLPHLTAELARLKVDVIFTGGAATIAAKDATKTIPIVMTNISDPVVTGLVTSLAHPGGNITGLAIQVPGLGGKRLELLKEALPRGSRVAPLWHLNNRL